MDFHLRFLFVHAFCQNDRNILYAFFSIFFRVSCGCILQTGIHHFTGRTILADYNFSESSRKKLIGDLINPFSVNLAITAMDLLLHNLFQRTHKAVIICISNHAYAISIFLTFQICFGRLDIKALFLDLVTDGSKASIRNLTAIKSIKGHISGKNNHYVLSGIFVRCLKLQCTGITLTSRKHSLCLRDSQFFKHFICQSFFR